jgi:NADH-quinone oxidoreductase subunit F
MVRNALVTTQFFEHESCGKCTPCREGTWWAEKVLERVEHGEGRQEDLDLLLDIADGMDGRSFCPLGDAAAWALRSNVKLFRDEFERHVVEGRCPMDDQHLAFAGTRSRGLGLGESGIASQPSSGIASDQEGN